MWQAKELGGRVSVCVASKGVTGEILEVWQGKELNAVASGEWLVASDKFGNRGVHIPVAIQRVRKELIAKELLCGRDAKECARDWEQRG